eukprot:TRINITY_DN15707_c0_g1_i1.p3 TRINITY_DN15707_c0_g1~~TRINITY_DN15707_c0_g1_i1.p3  ORF type:complete len:118 (+),score=5.51 TRINITY_DN15707_c0_g1_i1:76-429(+)
MIRRPQRSTHCISSAASDVYKRQIQCQLIFFIINQNYQPPKSPEGGLKFRPNDTQQSQNIFSLFPSFGGVRGGSQILVFSIYPMSLQAHFSELLQMPGTPFGRDNRRAAARIEPYFS